MNTQDDILDSALRRANEFADSFDFDCRELISSEMVDPVEGNSVIRIVMRLWTSDSKIEQTLSKQNISESQAFVKDVLARGQKLCVDATRDAVVQWHWLEIQLS